MTNEDGRHHVPHDLQNNTMNLPNTFLSLLLLVHGPAAAAITDYSTSFTDREAAPFTDGSLTAQNGWFSQGLGAVSDAAGAGLPGLADGLLDEVGDDGVDEPRHLDNVEYGGVARRIDGLLGTGGGDEREDADRAAEHGDR